MRDKRFFQLSQGEWALVGVTMIWGTTFLIIRNALDVTGPLFFVGLRFGSAALALLVISLPILRGLTVHELFAGSLIGLSLLGGYALQSYGLVTISASKSAFITAFYVPAVPVLQWLFMRHRPSNMAWLGVGCALVGLILLAGPDGVSLGFGAGEMLTLLGAVACALRQTPARRIVCCWITPGTSPALPRITPAFSLTAWMPWTWARSWTKRFVVMTKRKRQKANRL